MSMVEQNTRDMVIEEVLEELVKEAERELSKLGDNIRPSEVRLLWYGVLGKVRRKMLVRRDGR